MNHRLSTTIAVFGFLLCSALSACSEEVPTTAASSTSPVPTSTSLPTSSPQLTQTYTIKPTFTASPRPSLPPTPTETERPMVTATIDPIRFLTEQAEKQKETRVVSFPVVCEPSQRNETSLSASGAWLAVSCRHEQNQTLEVYSLSGREWSLQFKDFLAKEFVRDGMTGSGGLYPVHWTGDEKYLYFTSEMGFDGGGTCFYTFGVAGLFRLNLDTGVITTILPPQSSPEGYEVAFSPGGGKIAYTAEYLEILDVRTGKKDILVPTTGRDNAGNISWSSDGSRLAFSTCRVAEDPYKIDQSTIKIYALETQEMVTLMSASGDFLTLEPMTGNQGFRISLVNYQTGVNTDSIYDWSTRRLSTPTAKPE